MHKNLNLKINAIYTFLTMEPSRWVVNAFPMVLVSPHKHQVYKFVKNKVIVLLMESTRKYLNLKPHPMMSLVKWILTLAMMLKCYKNKIALFNIKPQSSTKISEGHFEHFTRACHVGAYRLFMISLAIILVHELNIHMVRHLTTGCQCLSLSNDLFGNTLSEWPKYSHG